MTALHFLRDRLQQLLRPVDVFVGRYGASIQGRRATLIRRRSIEVVVDVGANRGQWAIELRRCGYGRRILSVEPLAEAFQELRRRAAKDPFWTAQHFAVVDAKGPAEIRVSANSVSSSLLPMTRVHLDAAPDSRIVRTEPVPTITLGELVERHLERDGRFLLKLDVQGFERRILESSRSLFPRIPLLELETSVVRLYEGESLLSEMLDLLQGWGYRMVLIWPGFTDAGSDELLQVNSIFART